jgi:hypothetical protein
VVRFQQFRPTSPIQSGEDSLYALGVFEIGHVLAAVEQLEGRVVQLVSVRIIYLHISALVSSFMFDFFSRN